MESVPFLSIGSGRYLLQGFAGRGGMGTVYRALDKELDRIVAVKLVNARGEFRDLAIKEAKTLATINHPNVMHVYDVIQEDERVWLITEWLSGRSLSQTTGKIGPLAVAAIMAQIFEALEALHSVSIYHRDIKPSNIMLGTNGRIKLIDFGVAFHPAQNSGETVAGSLRYCDPQVLAGKAFEATSDLYSACLVLLELTSGEPVWPQLAPLPLYHHVTKNLQSRVSELCDGLYPPLAGVVQALTLTAKQDRASAAAARELLERAYKELATLSFEKYLAQCSERDDFSGRDSETRLREVTKRCLESTMKSKEKAAWIAFAAQNAFLTDDVPEPGAASAIEPPRVKRKSRWRRRTVAAAVVLAAVVAIVINMKRTLRLTPSEPPVVAEVSAPPPAAAAEVTPSRTAAEVTPPPAAAEITPPPAAAEIAPPPPAADVSEVKEPAVAAAEPLPPGDTAVTIKANAWADVFIDGKSLGRIPRAQPFKLPPGSHVLKLKSPFIETFEKQIDVPADKAHTFNFVLRQKMKEVILHLRQPAEMVIDGESHGVHQTKAVNLTFGRHSVVIIEDGEEVAVKEITVHPATANIQKIW